MEQHFLPYDYLRQPRRTWFVDEAGLAPPNGMSSRGKYPAESAGPPVHAQAIPVDDQPLAAFRSRSAQDSIPSSSGQTSALGSPAPRTPREEEVSADLQNGGVEMRERYDSRQDAEAAAAAAAAA